MKFPVILILLAFTCLVLANNSSSKLRILQSTQRTSTYTTMCANFPNRT